MSRNRKHWMSCNCQHQRNQLAKHLSIAINLFKKSEDVSLVLVCRCIYFLTKYMLCIMYHYKYNQSTPRNVSTHLFISTLLHNKKVQLANLVL